LDIYATKIDDEIDRKTNPKNLKPNLNLLKNLKEMMEKYYPPPPPADDTLTAEQSEVRDLYNSTAYFDIPFPSSFAPLYPFFCFLLSKSYFVHSFPSVDEAAL
jgi:hypothetical protein